MFYHKKTLFKLGFSQSMYASSSNFVWYLVVAESKIEWKIKAEKIVEIKSWKTLFVV